MPDGSLTAQIQLRVSAETLAHLADLVRLTGERQSDLLRRLIREEHSRRVKAG